MTRLCPFILIKENGWNEVHLLPLARDKDYPPFITYTNQCKLKFTHQMMATESRNKMYVTFIDRSCTNT